MSIEHPITDAEIRLHERFKLGDFRKEIEKLALDSKSPFLKDIPTYQLSQTDMDLYHKYQEGKLTLDDIQRQKRILADLSEVERAEEIMDSIENGTPLVLEPKDIDLRDGIIEGRITKAKIERQRKGLENTRARMAASLQLLEYMEGCIMNGFLQPTKE